LLNKRGSRERWEFTVRRRIKKIKIPSDITSKHKTGNYGEYLYPNSKVQEIPKDALDIRGC